MNPAGTNASEPWQPLTPRGVALFAVASWRRLGAVLLVFCALAGISTAAFFAIAWFPTLQQAMRKLPEEGYIRSGQLAWTGEPAVILAKSPWLAISVDVHHEQTHRVLCDLQVEFSGDSLRFISLAGYLDAPYPRGWIITFNEPELAAWWAAWKPFIVMGIGLGTMSVLLLAWAGLGLAYTIPAGAVCRFVDHPLSFGAVFRMCLAAQMPGCLLLSFTLLLYSVRAVDLVQWLFVFAAHVVVAWVYIGLAVFFLPSKTAKPRRKPNPFRSL
jgi:hypothetical protein